MKISNLENYQEKSDADIGVNPSLDQIRMFAIAVTIINHLNCNFQLLNQPQLEN